MQIEQVEVRTFEDETHDEQVSAFSSSSTKSREKSSLITSISSTLHLYTPSPTLSPLIRPLYHSNTPFSPSFPANPSPARKNSGMTFPPTTVRSTMVRTSAGVARPYQTTEPLGK
jgi:hypothetical protein